MTMNRRTYRHLFPALTFMMAATAIPVRAQQDMPPLDAAQVLRELEAAEKKQADSSRQRRQQIRATLQQGLASDAAASKLYEDAVRGTRFEGKDSQAAEFAEWRKTNAELLRSDRLQKAIQLHLRYLLLGMQRTSDGETAAAMAAPSLQYARDLAAFQADKSPAPLPREGAELLQRPAREGIFARWLSLSSDLPGDKEWESAAGNLDGILEKNIRAPWRAQKDARLLAAWDMQMDALSKRALGAELDIEADNIARTAKPRLVFNRASDKALLGQPNAAQKDILLLIREYPAHPDWPSWVARLREMLGGTPPAP